MEETIEKLLDKIEQLEAENKKLKDPFLHAPAKIICVSVDRDGAMHWDARKPIKNAKYGLWEHYNPFYFIGYDMELAKNWETLIMRKKEDEKL